MEPEDSLIMGNEVLSTIPKKESDEVIKYSVEEFVPITTESEDTSRSDSDCDLPSYNDFYPINVSKEKSVTISNPLFDSNEDFTSSDDESLSDEDVLKDKDIESEDSYVSKLDEPALIVTPLFDTNEDECFDPGGVINEVKACLTSNSISPKIDDADFDSEGDILLLEKLLSDDTSSPLPSKELYFEDLKVIKSPYFKDDYYDSEGDIIYLESLLIKDTIPNLPLEVFLDDDLRSLEDEPDKDDLKYIVKVTGISLMDKNKAKMDKSKHEIGRVQEIEAEGTYIFKWANPYPFNRPGTFFREPPYPFDYPMRRLTMEEILAKFIDEGRREHKKMEIFIKEFRTTNELLLKTRSNLLSELKIEVKELSKVVSNVLIPKNEVKGLTTRGGKMMSEASHSKKINEIGFNKKEPPRFEQDVQEKPHDDGVKNKSSSIHERTTQPLSKLEEACTETMNERFSTILLNELPSKEKYPRSFTTPCQVFEKHKEAEDLATDHLSRFKNPHMEVLTKREIANKFSDEHLMALKSKFNNDEPWAIKRILEREVGYNPKAELRDGAYENTKIYKERTKKWHDSRLRGDKDFKVNGQRLKKYYRGNIDKEDDEVIEFENGTVFREPPYPFDYPMWRLTMEEILAKFIDEGRHEHEEMEIFIKEFRTTNELLLKTQSNLLSELKIEVLSCLAQRTAIKRKRPRSFTTPCQVFEKPKEAEDLAVGHLSRFQKPHIEVLTKREIANKFSDKHLLVLKSKFINDEPWYADFINYIVGKVVPLNWTFEKRKRFLSQVKTYFRKEAYAFKLCADNIMRRCVAGSETLEILVHCHSGPTGGHHSANVTTKKVYESGFNWPSVFKNANEYVRQCDACQRLGNISSRNEMPQNNIQVCEVFDVWGLDFVGPFPESRGNKYILVAVDYVSKWVEAQALPMNDARVVVKFLRQLFARAIKRILERSVGYNPKGWSEKFNDALWAFRTAYKTPTGCTPFRLVYEKAFHLPIEIEHKAHLALKQCNMDLTLASGSRLMQLNELAELRDGAYENTRIYKEQTKKWHDSRLRGDKDFKVGDNVLLYNSRLKMYPGKIKSKWSGPNIVKMVYPHGAIEITDRDGVSFKVNGQRLKKYYRGNIDKEDDEVI
ncbi:reverse transcriptase domain-containing protein [Tanacetum coccineum]